MEAKNSSLSDKKQSKTIKNNPDTEKTNQNRIKTSKKKRLSSSKRNNQKLLSLIITSLLLKEDEKEQKILFAFFSLLFLFGSFLLFFNVFVIPISNKTSNNIPKPDLIKWDNGNLKGKEYVIGDVITLKASMSSVMSGFDDVSVAFDNDNGEILSKRERISLTQKEMFYEIKITSSKDFGIQLFKNHYPVSSKLTIPTKTIASFYEGEANHFVIQKGNEKTITIQMKPVGLTGKDIHIRSKDKTLRIVHTSFHNSDLHNMTAVDISLVGQKIGKGKIIVQSADKKQKKTFDVQVDYSETEKTVYVNTHGEHYHYSKKCAGKNSHEMKLYHAKKSYYDPCQKCVK